tara:strand:+ start:3735 stop:4571 length:837 start_codon:yes stop_codon:yes gene_type:complete
MGNIASTHGIEEISHNYPSKMTISSNSETQDPPATKPSIELEQFNDISAVGGDGVDGDGGGGDDVIAAKAAADELNKLYERLKTNIHMYSIYDNYDSKNKVILADLKKKERNQAKELKQLIEDRDKLKVVLDYDKNKSSKYVNGTTTIGRINILLLLLLIACIVLIIYRILTHPYGLIDVTKIKVEDLEKIADNDLDKLSVGELDDLDDILEQKIQQLEMMQNTNAKVNNLNSNSVNITRSNLDKKNSFTLSSKSNNSVNTNSVNTNSVNNTISSNKK